MLDLQYLRHRHQRKLSLSELKPKRSSLKYIKEERKKGSFIPTVFPHLSIFPTNFQHISPFPYNLPTIFPPFPINFPLTFHPLFTSSHLFLSSSHLVPSSSHNLSILLPPLSTRPNYSQVCNRSFSMPKMLDVCLFSRHCLRIIMN